MFRGVDIIGEVICAKMLLGDAGLRLVGTNDISAFSSWTTPSGDYMGMTACGQTGVLALLIPSWTVVWLSLSELLGTVRLLP